MWHGCAGWGIRPGVLGLLWLSASLASALDADTPRYYFSTFFGGTADKLYIASSFDGRRFDALGGAPVYTSPAPDTIRDPSIIRVGDAWYVCHTAGPGLGNVNYFSVLRSTNLVQWTKVTDVSMAAVSGTNYTWAPEWFRDADGSVHVIVGVSPRMSRDFVLYAVHPTNGEMTAWSAPVRLTGPAFPEFPANSPDYHGTYDGHITLRNGEYVITYEDTPTNRILAAKAPGLTGPYTVFKTGNWLGIGFNKEGGNMVHLGGTRWRFYFANALTSRMYSVESSDDWATWSVAQIMDSSVNFNHGTVVFNPDVPELRPSIHPQPSGRMRLRFPGVNRNGYQLETSPDLGTWTDTGSPIQSGGGDTEVEHDPLGADRLFYRIRWLPFHLPVD